jgi:hypothetical protein
MIDFCIPKASLRLYLRLEIPRASGSAMRIPGPLAAAQWRFKAFLIVLVVVLVIEFFGWERADSILSARFCSC